MSAWSSRGDRAHPDDAPLGVVGDDDEPPAGLDERPVGLGLQQVRGREPGARVHAVDAHEHEVEVDRPQGGDRERPDERVRRRPHAAGQDDRLVGAAAVVQHVRDRHGVGDDGQARHVDEPPGEGVGGRAGGDGRSPCPARRAAAAASAMASFSDLLERRLGREPGLEQGAAGRPPWRRRAPSRAARARRAARGRAGSSCPRRPARGPGRRPGRHRPRGRARGCTPGADERASRACRAPFRPTVSGNDPAVLPCADLPQRLRSATLTSQRDRTCES